jgi:acyl-CoA thioester hydrolase
LEDLGKFKHITKIKIRFSDLDAMKHVNNATYLTYLEEARIKYFNDLLKKNNGDIDYQAVVGRIEIDYLHPIVLGDDIEIYTRIAKLGNKSLDVEHILGIRRMNEFIVAATSSTKLVYFDYKTQLTKPIPDEERKIISKFEGLEF